ncbi:hypothetical protein CROQUDRAFT_658412 [Cronartium quercuum f. sp. fusiforme G11]|uniref:Uncharacterized protein n=1 Tax=Cronartium quercuum f. sp. fusiforme G11 TaxID=708437 RepID=A0A9P6NHD0_9BASI|nr:hypothetical protein CROQUDRAFT_658412 [Cronartium quercuum f. sp. fusiforme G11]
MPLLSKPLNPDCEEFFILVESGDDAGKWFCRLCKSKRPFKDRCVHCKSAIHRYLVAMEQEKKAKLQKNSPPGMEPNPQVSFSQADMEALGFALPDCAGASREVKLGICEGPSGRENTDGSEDKDDTMSDSSNFLKLLFAGLKVPNPVEVKKGVTMDRVPECFREAPSAIGGSDSEPSDADAETAPNPPVPTVETCSDANLSSFTRKEHLAGLLLSGSGRNLMSREEYSRIRRILKEVMEVSLPDHGDLQDIRNSQEAIGNGLGSFP